MLLQTFGLLSGVVGASYVLASASWQVVLFAFMFAGIGYALWQIRNALVRRAKIREYWRKSTQLEPLLKDMDNETAFKHFVEQTPELKPHKLKQTRSLVSSVSRFPIQKLTQKS